MGGIIRGEMILEGKPGGRRKNEDVKVNGYC